MYSMPSVQETEEDQKYKMECAKLSKKLKVANLTILNQSKTILKQQELAEKLTSYILSKEANTSWSTEIEPDPEKKRGQRPVFYSSVSLSFNEEEIEPTEAELSEASKDNDLNKLEVEAASSSIYDRIGQWSQQALKINGEAALHAAVDDFYVRIIEDSRLKKFFVGVDLKIVKHHQFLFMRHAFSGSFPYNGKSLEAGHARLFHMGLDGFHFDCVAENLVATLQSLNVPGDIQTDILGVVGPLKQIFIDGEQSAKDAKAYANLPSQPTTQLNTTDPQGQIQQPGAELYDAAKGNDLTKVEAEAASSSIYDRIGQWSQQALKINGEAALHAAVDDFYVRIIEDSRLKKFFVGVDLKIVKHHQFLFMRHAFSGSFPYNGKSLEAGHARLFHMGLDGFHFDCVAENLVATLQSLNVPGDIQTDILGVVGPLKQIFIDGKQLAIDAKDAKANANPTTQLNTADPQGQIQQPGAELFDAVKGNDLTKVKALLSSEDSYRTTKDHRAMDVNYKHPVSGRTALIMAAEGGNLEILCALVEAGADLDLLDKMGHSALVAAALKGKEMLVALLRDAGASFAL
jgi:hemoglobin